MGDTPGNDTTASRAQQMVRELLAERKEVLVLYNRIAGTSPFGGQDSAGVQQKNLQSFCQLLVDYLATGHFGLYETIRGDGACQVEVWEQAEKAYPKIADTTDALLNFNDKYNCAENCPVNDELHTDLSRVGELLAARIELEDSITAPVCDGCAECLPA